MSRFDLPLDELRDLPPGARRTRRLRRVLGGTLDEARAHAARRGSSRSTPGCAPSRRYDVTFAGFGGQPVKGWLIVPQAAVGPPCRCVVEFIGYGGGRGLPHELLLVAVGRLRALRHGHARPGQRLGARRDAGRRPGRASSPSVPGLHDPRHPRPARRYYYRRVFTDAVARRRRGARAPARSTRTRVVVTGGSQGGGIALAVAGLVDRTVAACMPDVPFLCHFRRATDDHRRAIRTARSRATSQMHRDRVDAGVPDAVVLRRRELRGRGRRRRRCSRSP